MSATRTHVRYPEQHERDAARRYLEHDHAAQSLSGEPRRTANGHARAIDEEHPRARDIAMTGTERELGQLPKHLKHHQRHLRQQAGLSQEQVAQIRNEYRRGPYQEPGQPQPQASSPSAASRVDQGLTGGIGLIGSGISAAGDTSWGELVGEFFIGGILLSLAYLLLAKDASAVGDFFKGAANVSRAVISPRVDPLNPKGTL